MQPMSDKELDKLFQEKFESFEVEPSAGLWAKIDAEMGDAQATQKKKVFPIFWMAAASVLIVMAAGLYFMPQQDTIKLQGKSKQIAVNKPELKEKNVEQVTEPAVSPSEKRAEPQQGSTRKLIASNKSKERRNVNPLQTETKFQSAVEDDKASKVRVAALNVDPVKPQDVVPTSHTVKEIDKKANTPSFVAMLSVPEKTIENNNSVEQAMPRQKIRSLGDLVNRVVAKVDPREEKIIQFSDNDEGTEISGINLGLIKFKHNHNNK